MGIIDRNGNGANHGLNHDVVVKEMGEAGYKLVGTYDFTKADGEDYFLIFQVRSEAGVGCEENFCMARGILRIVLRYQDNRFTGRCVCAVLFL